MSARKNVTASTVRSWARENIDKVPEAARAGLGENARGPLHSEIVTAFRKANRGKTYEPKVAEAKTITVSVPDKDKRGRNMKRKVTLTTAEAREVLGQPTSKRGRIREADLIAALTPKA